MIFVTVGTQKQNFSRIFKMVENSNCLQNEEIFVQTGYTKYVPTKGNVKVQSFLNEKEFEEKIEEANLVICHGGVGSIFSSIKSKKKVIAIPRLSKYGEHVNDHQVEICETLEDMGYIAYFKEGEDFEELIKETREKIFKEYVQNNDFLDVLRENI